MNLIRTTKSICPICYRLIDANVYENNGAVYMEKSCAEHGAFTDLCWSDYQLYQLFEARDIEGAGSRGTTETELMRTAPSAAGCAHSMNQPRFWVS